MQKGGDSPRFTLRLNDEIQKILADIDQKQRSDFIRQAILHYASISTYQSSDSLSRGHVSMQMREKEQSTTPVRILHKPAWQR